MHHHHRRRGRAGLQTSCSVFAGWDLAAAIYSYLIFSEGQFEKKQDLPSSLALRTLAEWLLRCFPVVQND
jgi:hypothetical protein